MNQATSDPSRLLELEALTREYSRYAGSAGGLSSMLGGVLCAIAYFVGALAQPGVATGVLLVSLPLAWLIAKSAIAKRYYQRFGAVAERVDRDRSRVRLWLLLAVAAVVVVIVAGRSGSAAGDGSLSNMLSLAFLALLVPVAWRWLHTPLDLAVGAFLWCQAVLALDGGGYAFWSSAIVQLPTAALMFTAGLREHLRFRQIAQRLTEWRGASVP